MSGLRYLQVVKRSGLKGMSAHKHPLSVVFPVLQIDRVEIGASTDSDSDTNPHTDVLQSTSSKRCWARTVPNPTTAYTKRLYVGHIDPMPSMLLALRPLRSLRPICVSCFSRGVTANGSIGDPSRSITHAHRAGSKGQEYQLTRMQFESEESPSGMLARSGTYNVQSRVVDDDKTVWLDFEWCEFTSLCT